MFDRDPSNPIELLDPEAWDVPASLSPDDCRGQTGWDGLLPSHIDAEKDDDR